MWVSKRFILSEGKRCNKCRSSHQKCCVKKGVLRNFPKFTGKHLCRSLFLNNVACLGPATLLKKRLWYRCFPVNFAKFLRRPFLQNTPGRLLLQMDCKFCNREFCSDWDQEKNDWERYH